MKLVFIGLDFWTNNEEYIEELIQTASGNHDVFRSLMEAEYGAATMEADYGGTTALEDWVSFDCTVENLVDSYNECSINEIQPISVVIQFEN